MMLRFVQLLLHNGVAHYRNFWWRAKGRVIKRTRAGHGGRGGFAVRCLLPARSSLTPAAAPSLDPLTGPSGSSSGSTPRRIESPWRIAAAPEYRSVPMKGGKSSAMRHSTRAGAVPHSLLWRWYQTSAHHTTALNSERIVARCAAFFHRNASQLQHTAHRNSSAARSHFLVGRKIKLDRIVELIYNSSSASSISMMTEGDGENGR